MSLSGPGGPRSNGFEVNDRSCRAEAASLDTETVKLPWFNRLASGYRRNRSIVRLLCVLTLVLAHGLHAMCPFQPVQGAASPTAVVTAQSDQNSDSSMTTSEACHMCSVVPFLTAPPSIRAALEAPVIPDGATMRLSVFANSLTAPPPKA
jgi:hypothetical protein